MSQLTAEQAFQIARQQHQSGRLGEAEAHYRHVLSLQPQHADALHLLGVLAFQCGRNDIATELIGRAVAIKPHYPDAFNHLGAAFKAMGKYDEAIAACRQAVALRPNFPGAYSNLGSALKEKGEFEQAIAAYRQAIAGDPRFAEAHSNLGNAFHENQQYDEAIAAHRQAIALKPDYAAAYVNLCSSLRAKGAIDEAITICRHALALNPNFPEAYSNLAVALLDKGAHEDAIAACRHAIGLRPDFAEAHHALANALRGKGRLDEAIEECQRAIALKPNHAAEVSDLGNALKDKGEMEQAIVAYRQAVALKPESAWLHSNLLYALHLHPAYDTHKLAEEHREWNRRHAQPLKQFLQPHANDRDPKRRLRVGYVSPDFWSHPVGRFLLPLLAHHDKTQVEVFAYSNAVISDGLTASLRSHVDGWRNIAGITDPAAAEMIRGDQIDILVDLTMHTARNRLPLFARKPAPVQVSYLAYCGSTGVETVDYRLSDAFLDPPGGADETLYSERTVRLSGTYWCYQPIFQSPEGGPLPALRNGYLTFGSMNNFCKVSDDTLTTWGTILRTVPKSRLILHVPEGTAHLRVVRRLSECGVEVDRVTCVAYQPNEKYFEVYHGIDIGLDPFPYAGGTTTCDALWMGVPVVSLAGTTGVGRAGVSILSNVGLPELIGTTREQYVAIACRLAGDLERLTELRQGLRTRMTQSPLMDNAGYTRGVEAALRGIWAQWCANGAR